MHSGTATGWNIRRVSAIRATVGGTNVRPAAVGRGPVQPFSAWEFPVMSVTRIVAILAVISSPLLFSEVLQVTLEAAQQAGHGPSPHSALVNAVREATEPFVNVRDVPAGYGAALGCVSGPEAGAMGVHFVNGDLLGDGELDAARPEALIYEFKDGVGRLVGAEFIVFADVWHTSHSPQDPPILEGQLLHFVESPNRFGLPAFYELHVWAWQENPNGAFVDWNPRVSCEGQ